MTESAVFTHESSLLLTLEEISQLVSHSHNPGETLANIVALIQGRFHSDVCSVYLLQGDKEQLVLSATIGLEPASVGQVRMRLDEGLTGLVAERMAPVMVDEAFDHPRFKYFPEAGEDLYHSFLGVPLIEGGSLQGVLVIQTREPRTFSQNEVRMLVAVGAQLAPLVSEARLIEQVMAVAHKPEPVGAPSGEPTTLYGQPLSPGVGLGQAYLISHFEEWYKPIVGATIDRLHEQARLEASQAAAREEIGRLSQRICSLVGEDHGAILQGQMLIMQDSTIAEDLRLCLLAGSTAEAAVLQTLKKYAEAFQKLPDPYFQERANDVKDVFRRILWHLLPAPDARASGDRLVLIAPEASVMDLFSVDFDRLAAVAVEHGGAQSHAAILARSLKIPMVGSVAELHARVTPGRYVQVDGLSGIVTLDPPATTADGPQPVVPAPSPTIRQLPPRPILEANINLLCEVSDAVKHQIHGVGLYRSEFLFLARRTLPTEEEQVGIYRKLLASMGGRPVSIRTYDLRPDKVAHTTHAKHGSPLDWRLALQSQPIQQLFKEQVRAILRAAADGPAKILIPLVTRTELVELILRTIHDAERELKAERLPYAKNVPVGLMVEVAAAITMVPTWAKHVDYIALGTNDLLASCLGIDREDPVGATADDPLHPGFMRLLLQVIDAAHEAGKPVTVCGEMASDSIGALALAFLGVDALSVAVPRLEATREALSKRFNREDLAFISLLPRIHDAKEVRRLVAEWVDEPESREKIAQGT